MFSKLTSMFIHLFFQIQMKKFINGTYDRLQMRENNTGQIICLYSPCILSQMYIHRHSLLTHITTNTLYPLS